MPTITYAIDTTNLPKGADSCILWAMRQWEKDRKGAVSFIEAKKADILISGGKPPDGSQAYCQPLGRGAYSITFDPSLKWGTTWWHRLIGRVPDFRLLAKHELGHAQGFEHSDDQASIMHPRPTMRALT